MTTNTLELELVMKNVELILKFKKKFIIDAEYSMSVDEFEKIIHSLLPSFYNEYPVLCKMIVTNNDLDILYKMIDKLIRVEHGNESIDKVKTDLGDDLAEKYIFPHFGKPMSK